MAPISEKTIEAYDGRDDASNGHQVESQGDRSKSWAGLTEVLACILLFLADYGDRSPPRQLMPTYEYSCEKCGKTFETFQSMRDEPFRQCPKELCLLPKWGHGKTKRLLGTGAGLIFKGSGFYITDYRSNSYKEGAKKDAPAAPVASGEKSSGTTVTKESGSAKAGKESETKSKTQANK